MLYWNTSMNRLIAVLVFSAAVFADTAETVYFRGVMLPSNEVPAVNVTATGNATIIAHLVRDDSGKITSAAVDFNVNFAFSGPITLTGLHIHAAPAGVNGSITV